jgi:ABC-type multidrug transport system fused ATPase/permease subunit
MYKEYSILNNWKFVFGEMFRYDNKYPWYILVKSIAAFLAPFIAAIIPSVAIELVSKKAGFAMFFCIMLVLVLCNLVMGIISTKLDFIIKNKNYCVSYQSVQKNVISKIMDVDYEILESAEGKKWADGAKYSYSSEWNGWNRIMDMFTPFAYNLLGILVYTIILIPKCPWVLPVFAIMSVMNVFLEKKISANGYRKYRETIWETDSRVEYFFQRSTSATDGKDIRLYGMEKWFVDVMDILVKRRMKVWKRVEMYYFLPNLSDTIWSLLRDIIAYTILVNHFLAGDLNATTFTFYLGIIAGFAGWLNGGNMGDGFVRANSEMMRCNWGINDYRSFMELYSPEDKKNIEVSNSVGKSSTTGIAIEFKNVCFRYPGAEKDVIHNLNLKVNAGENIALVGVNGAGKTTLVKLLCGFYHPDSGEILVNGKSISYYSGNEYRKLVSAVFQDMMIMATSVAENIACDKQENIDEEKLWESIRLADIEDKILSLPNREKTSVTNFIDKDGVLFSGGELQRILLARALYKRAPLLLLDEPTSALDPLAETAIYEQYHKLSRGKTTVFISHRLASTKFCDRIIFYEDGHVKEDGTHEELMAQNGSYAKMFEIQSQYYNEKGGGLNE